MKVSELIEQLQKLPSNLKIMKAKDDEGNGYQSVDDLEEMMCKISSDYDEECWDIKAWESEMDQIDGEDNENWERVVVIW